MQSKSDYDWLVKVIIIGDSGVGKTNVLLRLTENKFKDDHMATLGVDFKIKTIKVEDKVIKMQIWDTAGQDRFKTITKTYYKGAAGIILTYSINDRASFDHISNWMAQIQENSAKNVFKYLIANKCDAERVVDKSEGIYLAQQHGIPFAEVSAKDGTGIEQLFYDLGSKIRYEISNNNEFASTASVKKPGESQVKKPQQLNQTSNQDDVLVNEKNQSGGCKC